MSSIYTIYKATNTVNGKVYIGFDSNYPARKRCHKCCYKTEPYKFYHALRKYGWESFNWEPIYQSKDKKHTLKIMEPYFIKEYNSFNEGYNSTLGGDGSVGYITSEETKQKQRISALKRKRTCHTEASKEKMRQKAFGNKNCLGHKHSIQSKQKMSEALKNSWAKRKQKRVDSVPMSNPQNTD